MVIFINVYLVEIWESIQQQAQSNGDVTTPNGTVS